MMDYYDKSQLKVRAAGHKLKVERHTWIGSILKSTSDY